MNKHIAVTIDGPAGAGKTAAARGLAKELPGFRYVDTGAFYRLLALYRRKHQEDDWLTSADGSLRAVPGDNGSQRMEQLLDGAWTPVPDKDLRTPETSEQASILSTDPTVRAVANKLIRDYASGTDCVMEGRDTGTAVMPKADFKFYLDADRGVRAGRRHKDMSAIGEKKTLEEVESDLARRDERDANREHDPLRVPDGAIVLDNTHITAKQTIRFMKDIVAKSIPLRREGTPE